MSATPKMTGGSIDLAAHNLKTSIEQIDTPWKVAVGFLLILSVGYGAKLGDMLDMNKISLRSLAELHNILLLVGKFPGNGYFLVVFFTSQIEILSEIGVIFNLEFTSFFNLPTVTIERKTRFIEKKIKGIIGKNGSGPINFRIVRLSFVPANRIITTQRWHGT